MRYLLLFILLHASPFSGAQEVFSRDDERIFHAGVQSGANFCQVDGDGFSGYRKVGFAGNALVYVRVLPILHLSLGLGYAQKGSRESSIRETAIGPAVFRYRLDLNYVEMPLLAHLFFGGRLHYSAGFSYARLISSKEESEDVNPILISPELYPFRKQDWAGIVCINYQVYHQWFLSGQYQYTIGSIRDLPQIPPGYGFANERNNLMSLRLLYIIKSGATR